MREREKEGEIYNDREIEKVRENESIGAARQSNQSSSKKNKLY